MTSDTAKCPYCDCEVDLSPDEGYAKEAHILFECPDVPPLLKIVVNKQYEVVEGL